MHALLHVDKDTMLCYVVRNNDSRRAEVRHAFRQSCAHWQCTKSAHSLAPLSTTFGKKSRGALL